MIIKNEFTKSIENNDQNLLTWVKDQRSGLRVVKKSIKATKNALKTNWNSFLSLKENRPISEREIKDVIAIRDYENLVIKTDIDNHPRNKETLQILANQILKNIESLNALEKQFKSINKNMLNAFDENSEFTKNCLAGPKNLKILIKQYQTMNCFSKFLKSFTFSMPKNLLDYISEDNQLNPIENEKIKQSLFQLAKTSKICSKLQILSLGLYYATYFFLKFIDNRLIDSLSNIKNILIITGLLPLIFPIILFSLTMNLSSNQSNFYVSIKEYDIRIGLITVLSSFFWIILDVRRASYFKHFDAISEEANTIES